MTVGSGRERDEFTWRPGRGVSGGAVTGVWLTLLLGAATTLTEGFGSGWRLELVAIVVGDLVGTVIVAVPVLALVGSLLRSSSRVTTVTGYAAAALLARVLLGPMVESAVGAAPVAGGAQMAMTAIVSLVAGVVAAVVSTRDRLPRTTGLLRFRVGGPSTGGGVAGPSAAPAPAPRYLSGGP